MAASCVRCGLEVRGNYDSTCDIECGSCVQRGAAIASAREDQRRSGLDPQVCVDLRRDSGYTQKDLALRLRVTVGELSAFEQGKGLCPRKVEEWMMGTAGSSGK